MSHESQLRKILCGRTVVAPGAINALVAKLIEKAGFDAVYVSGAGLANSYCLPDIGLLTLTEVVQQVKWICEAVDLPVLVDVDTGFGEAVNVSRTVRELEKIGVAGIHIEDQDFPKRCGHLQGKRCISVEAMVEKLQTALESRSDSDFIIIARTDARNVEGLNSAIDRAQRYLEAGADGIFPEALESEKEFSVFSQSILSSFPSAILLANMTEFGKTPYLSVQKFSELGYRIVIFPLTAMRIALKSIVDALTVLKEQGTQVSLLEKMLTRDELYQILDYSLEEKIWGKLKSVRKRGE